MSQLGLGRKNDGFDGVGDVKMRWELLPFGAVSWVVEVMTYGAKKYGPNNWQMLLSPDGRYFAAAMRHLVAWRLGEVRDVESGLPHLAHATCCLIFMLSNWSGFDRVLDSEDVSK